MRLVLPADLTQSEAARICGVVSAVAFPDEPSGAHPDPGYERTVHHIDGNPCNNDPANLIVVDARGSSR